jgi:hypothetical protein
MNPKFDFQRKNTSNTKFDSIGENLSSKGFPFTIENFALFYNHNIEQLCATFTASFNFWNMGRPRKIYLIIAMKGP